MITFVPDSSVPRGVGRRSAVARRRQHRTSGGSLRTRPLPYFLRPPEEREVIRHKSYALRRLTPEEAVIDMELLDYGFHLFTEEEETDQDSVVHRSEGG